ncbi:PIN domain-containing protein [Inhella gelatinilytica]|uniref:PIN domain-containing protein n=1 Tax=Inhella gelatinilytica TaxID=2795030 RepID=A0A931NC70_9BURK|nr:PIN domain-containing protein [Inhella gelatinilytica]MBH9554373.1 PIN domain-containing protein [Inhella gelatinilytica]
MQGLSRLADEIQPHQPPVRLVLDTHVLLDLWLFQDARLAGFEAALQQERVTWLASPAMLDELHHVAHRPWEDRWRALPRLFAPQGLYRLCTPPTQAAPWRSKDPDDQKFLDLAWQEQPVRLWSRDLALLRWAKRAAAHGIQIERPEDGWRAVQACWSTE